MENKSANPSPEDKPKAVNKSQLPSQKPAAPPATGRKPFELCIDLESLQMLERLDNLRLDLQRAAPLAYRKTLGCDTVIEYLIDYVLDEYDDGAGTSSVVTRFKEDLADIRKDADSAD